MARAPEKCESCGEWRPDVCLHPSDPRRICVPCRTRRTDYRASATAPSAAADDEARPSGLVWGGPDPEVFEDPW